MGSSEFQDDCNENNTTAASCYFCANQTLQHHQPLDLKIQPEEAEERSRKH